MVLAISRLNTVIQIALMGFCVLSPLGSPVHLYTTTILTAAPPSSFHCPSNSRVSENGPRAAVLLPLSPGLAPPAELLPTPGQPRLDPVQAPHEDSLPVQVQSSPSQMTLNTERVFQRPPQLQEPASSLTGSRRSPVDPLHVWWPLLPGVERVFILREHLL